MLTYEGSGNPTTYNGSTLTLDAGNRLIGIPGISWLADNEANGLRAWRIILMSTQFHLSSVTEEYNKFLPGLSKRPRYALWLKSLDWNFQSDDLKDLQHAFAPLRGIAWYASSRTNSNNNKTIDNPFDEWPGFVAESISECVLSFSASGNVIISKVAWLSSDAYINMPSFLQRRPLYGQGIISFIPNEKSDAVKWAKIIQGPSWLWLCRDWIANSPEPSLDADAVTLSYINLTQEMNGSTGLMWVSSDMETGLVFFGSKEVLTSASTRLKKNTNFYEDAKVFDKISNRGFSLEMCK